MSLWITRIVHLLVWTAPLAFWELAAQYGWTDPRILPSPSTISLALLKLLADPRFYSELGFTVGAISITFLIVAPLGLATGFYLGANEKLYNAFAPALHLLLAIPKSIFLPVFILALGIGLSQKVAFAASLSFFIIVLSGISAVQSVPEGLVQAARTFGASRPQIYSQIYFPAMEPLIISGLRLGAIFTITGVLLGEMYASPRGLGGLIFVWGESLQMPELFAGITIVMAITLLVNQGLTIWEIRRTPLHKQAT